LVAIAFTIVSQPTRDSAWRVGHASSIAAQDLSESVLEPVGHLFLATPAGYLGSKVNAPAYGTAGRINGKP